LVKICASCATTKTKQGMSSPAQTFVQLADSCQIYQLKRLIVQSFNTRLPRVIYHQKAFETMDEIGPPNA